MTSLPFGKTDEWNATYSGAGDLISLQAGKCLLRWSHVIVCVLVCANRALLAVHTSELCSEDAAWTLSRVARQHLLQWGRGDGASPASCAAKTFCRIISPLDRLNLSGQRMQSVLQELSFIWRACPTARTSSRLPCWRLSFPQLSHLSCHPLSSPEIIHFRGWKSLPGGFLKSPCLCCIEQLGEHVCRMVLFLHLRRPLSLHIGFVFLQGGGASPVLLTVPLEQSLSSMMTLLN